MTMKRILQCVLVSIVIATMGCSLVGGSSSTLPSNRNRNAAANTNANQATVTQSTPTGTQSHNSVPANQNATPKNQNTVSPNQNTASLNQNAAPVNQNTTPQDQNTNSLNQNTAAQTQNTVPGNQNTTPQNTDETEGWLSDLLMLILEIAGGLLVLFLIFMVVQHLRAQSKRNLEAQLAKVAGAQIAATKEGQKELTDRLTSLTTTQKEIINGLLDLHTEVRSLARLMRESDRNDRRRSSTAINYQAQMEDSLKDEPEFPVSAGDYLGKMDRFANIVRPDFQNGILVNDPEGKGELMLIRDSRLADESQLLFVVPRATQFQTQQDFYTYYEKYYDCARPTAGDVWILGPAVVEKVNGGWRLREKGMLEIR